MPNPSTAPAAAPVVVAAIPPVIATQRAAVRAAARDYLTAHGDGLFAAVHHVAGDAGAALARGLRADILAAHEWHSVFGRRLAQVLRLLHLEHVAPFDQGPYAMPGPLDPSAPRAWPAPRGGGRRISSRRWRGSSRRASDRAAAFADAPLEKNFACAFPWDQRGDHIFLVRLKSLQVSRRTGGWRDGGATLHRRRRRPGSGQVRLAAA